MLRLKKIFIYNFRNLPHLTHVFAHACTAIIGENGQGKTNFLNAIYYLAYSKPYKFSSADKLNICHGADEMAVHGAFAKNGEELDIRFSIQDQKKKLQINDRRATRLSEVVGKIPLIIVTPDDISIINGTSEQRRIFLDALLSLQDFDYLNHLLDYNKILKARNAYLKMINDIEPNFSYLKSLDTALIIHSDYIYLKRKSIFDEIEDTCNMLYEILSNKKDKISLKYHSDLHLGTMKTLLHNGLQKDIKSQRTIKGIHKDEVLLEINNLNAKDFASQGQKKSLLFSLKLTVFEILRKQFGFSPMVLLDDMFEKLDDSRIHNLISYLNSYDDIQLFVSDTHKDRIVQYFKDWDLGIIDLTQ